MGLHVARTAHIFLSLLVILQCRGILQWFDEKMRTFRRLLDALGH